MPDNEERRRGVQIIIVPDRQGPTRSLTLPPWRFRLVLGGLAALVVVLIGGVILGARMGLELNRLRGVKAENDSLRAENRRVQDLELELAQLDGFRRRVLELAGADVQAEVESKLAQRGTPAGTDRGGEGVTGFAEAGLGVAGSAGAGLGMEGEHLPAARDAAVGARGTPGAAEGASRGTSTAEPLPAAPAPGSVQEHDPGSLPTLWPAEGVVSKEFRPSADVDRLHHGIDIAAPYGAPVRAAGAGVVVFAGPDSVFGQLVVLSHGKVDGGAEVRSLYGHNSSLHVKKGVRVKAGQEIARVGSTGSSSAPHLHFEVRRAGEPVDPRLYLGK